jgi:hypothetical protein
MLHAKRHLRRCHCEERSLGILSIIRGRGTALSKILAGGACPPGDRKGSPLQIERIRSLVPSQFFGGLTCLGLLRGCVFGHPLNLSGRTRVEDPRRGRRAHRATAPYGDLRQRIALTN